MRWLGTACFEILLPSGKTIVTDPYMDDSHSAPFGSDRIEGCDYIFITHGHFDHVTDVGKLCARFNSKIFCSDTTAKALIEHQDVSPALFNEVTTGDIVQEKDLKVEVVRGVHVDLTKLDLPAIGQKTADPQASGKTAGSDFPFEKLQEWMVNYPGGEQLNFIFDPVGGKRIYMAGSYPDPSLIEVAQTAEAHIALLQVMGGNLLRGLEEQTTSMAIASGCKIMVPQHHDPLMPGAPETDLAELKRILKEKSHIEFKEFIPGQWYEFD